MTIPPADEPSGKENNPNAVPTTQPDPWADQLRQHGRVMIIHRAFNELKKDEYLTQDELGELCGITRQAIAPYLRHMEDDLLLPITKGPAGGYAYKEKVDIVPHLLISQQLCYQLMLAIKSSNNFCTKKEGDAIKRWYRRISALIGEEANLDFKRMDRCLSFSSILTPRFDPSLIQFFWRCATERIQVELTYKTPNSDTKPRTLDVLHVRKLLHDWIVYAYDHLSKEFRKFSLSRMEDILVTGKTFDPHIKFKLSKYLDGAFEVYTGGEKVDVKLYFRKQQSHIIRENDVSCETTREDRPCGGLILGLKVSSFIDLLKFMRTFGNDCVPLEPRSIVQEWHDIANLMARDSTAVLNGTFQFDPPEEKKEEAAK